MQIAVTGVRNKELGRRQNSYHCSFEPILKLGKTEKKNTYKNKFIMPQIFMWYENNKTDWWEKVWCEMVFEIGWRGKASLGKRHSNWDFNKLRKRAEQILREKIPG